MRDPSDNTLVVPADQFGSPRAGPNGPGGRLDIRGLNNLGRVPGGPGGVRPGFQ
jgi:hypothetical protein